MTTYRSTDRELDAELEAAVQAVAAAAVDDWWRAATVAREQPAATEAGQDEAHLLPLPEFPSRPRYAGTVRWSCRYGCGWSHTELPGLEPMGPIVVPANPRPEDVTAAITRQAEERHRALLARVTDAFTGHYAAAHPEPST